MAETTARKPVINLPIALTIARIFAVPALIVCLYVGDDIIARWIAFALFIFASFTDWLDGHLARLWKQQSALGTMLDPIADKLLVGAMLLMLVYDGTISDAAIIPAVIILCREILVSGLREYLATLNVKVLVTYLAKWKTFLQFVSLGLLLISPAIKTQFPSASDVALVLLWIAAVLTIWTGADYLHAGIKHATNSE